MTPSIACGIAIVMVEHLPVVADYWSDAFYRATFTRAEIADCLLREQPLVHLAARWCAKKALQKCDPVYLQTDLCLLEVRLSARGAPYLCAVVDGYRTPLAFAVSLSHTTQAAVAVVVEVPTLPGARGTDTPATAAEAGGRWHSTWLPLLMGHS
jgi:phosphopantetheinyl transferase (holo-ACP synthase)